LAEERTGIVGLLGLETLPQHPKLAERTRIIYMPSGVAERQESHYHKRIVCVINGKNRIAAATLNASRVEKWCWSIIITTRLFWKPRPSPQPDTMKYGSVLSHKKLGSGPELEDFFHSRIKVELRMPYKGG
jgi:hypothetical protein